ncbi:MAG: hypothetical protein KGL32_06780 [candidate division NC10 bacterium]|nr:hypothetical protein [candidate division NC10 bacterium]
MFVRGVDNRIYLSTRVKTQSDGIWSGWSEVPGNGLTQAAPTAVVNLQGNIELFVQGQQ